MMHCIRTALKVVRQNRNNTVRVQSILNLNHLNIVQPRCYVSQIDDIGKDCMHTNFKYSTGSVQKPFFNAYLFTDAIVDNICKGEAELEKKLRILMLEVEVMRQDGRHAPDKINKEQWEHLLDLSTKNQRASYLRYLFKTEKSKENFKAIIFIQKPLIIL